MIRNDQSLIHYVELVTGLRPRLDEAPPPAATLPLFLREQYEFAEMDLFGRRVPLAVEKTPPEELSASEYARNAAMLRQGFGQDVVLVMAKLPSYVRNRLVQEGVPFIVPWCKILANGGSGVGRPTRIMPSAKLSERLWARAQSPEDKRESALPADVNLVPNGAAC